MAAHTDARSNPQIDSGIHTDLPHRCPAHILSAGVRLSGRKQTLDVVSLSLDSFKREVKCGCGENGGEVMRFKRSSGEEYSCETTIADRNMRWKLFHAVTTPVWGS